AVANRHDIAPLQCGQTIIRVWISPPDREAGILEIRMEFVDGSDVDRLQLACVPAHGIQRYPAIDPACCVTGEKMIGQRRQDEILRSEYRRYNTFFLYWQFRLAHSPHQDGRERIGVDLHQHGSEIMSNADTNRVVVDPSFQEPPAGFDILHGFG